MMQQSFVKTCLQLKIFQVNCFLQEVFDEGVPLARDTLIQVWKGGEIYEMTSVSNFICSLLTM